MKLLLSIIFIAYSIYGAEFKYENILQGVPDNYKLGYRFYDKNTHTEIFEFIPKDEKVENWSEMITTNIYHRNIDFTTVEYLQRIGEMWTSSCQEGFTKMLHHGQENGYDFALIMMACPKSKVTNKEEITWLKAIKGNDSFYSVQKTFTYNPTKKEVLETMHYLRKVQICDTRLNNCPKNRK